MTVRPAVLARFDQFVAAVVAGRDCVLFLGDLTVDELVELGGLIERLWDPALVEQLDGLLDALIESEARRRDGGGV